MDNKIKPEPWHKGKEAPNKTTVFATGLFATGKTKEVKHISDIPIIKKDLQGISLALLANKELQRN